MYTRMPCPFLNRLSSSYVRRYGPGLAKSYGQHCPVMSRLVSSTDVPFGSDAALSKCPFLAENGGSGAIVNEASKEMQEDIMEFSSPSETGRGRDVRPADQDSSEAVLNISGSQKFEYENFFHEQIMKKKKDHSYRVFKKVNRLASDFPTALECSREERPIMVWCANDYLGMSCHPDVKQAVRDAVESSGAGSGGTRNISGTSLYHEQLERDLASWHNKQAALLFTSCFVANDSTLFTLATSLPGCHIFSDEGNHASMIHGIRNSRAPKHIFRHNDPAHLAELLRKVGPAVPKIVAFETVHSMTGAICPLKELCEIAHEFGALTFVDEVHAVGLYGDYGAGIGERDGEMLNMDIVTGTLGKAFGNIGGYIAGTRNLIDMIRNCAAGFIFTTSLPPTVVAGAQAALSVIRSEHGRRLRQLHQLNVAYLRYRLIQAGFPVEHSSSHIIPVWIGDPEMNTKISDCLLREKGHYIQAINHPTVPRGQEKLRLVPTPHHTRPMMARFVADLQEVWLHLGLPLAQSPCTTCHKPLQFIESSVSCNVPSCPQLVAVR